MQLLRQNTATIVTVGPFLDKGDGVTLETALTITNERISFTVDANDGSAPTLVLDNVTGATSGTSNDLNYITNADNAMMQLELSAANTNYVGRAMLTITDAANHCPVFHEYMILPANVYDSLVAGTDKLDTNAAEVGGTSQTGRDLGASVLLSVGTGTGQVNLSSGKVPATLAPADVSGNVPADLQTIKARAVTDPGASVAIGTNVAQVGSAMGAVASVTAGVTLAADQAVNVTKWKGATAPAMTGDAYARLGAPAGASVSADVAAVKSDAAAILSDTGTDGVLVATAAKTGYALTADYDAAKAAASQTSVNDLPTNAELATALAGADDATLAAIAALNNLSSAQAQSAAAAALAAYDPPTKAELDSGLAAADDAVLAVLGVAGAGLTAIGDTRLANLDAAVSTRSTYAGGAVASVTGNVGGNVAGSVGSVTSPVTAGTVSDKTGYSLATAPPTAADVATAVWGATTRTLSGFGTLVADVASAVWAAAQRTLTAFGFSISATVDEGAIAEAVDTELTTNHGAGAWGGATGSGASAVTVTVTCAGAPVIGAWVTVKNSAQTATVAGPVKTNTSGQAVFALDDGSYKALVASTPAYEPLAAATLTVSGTTPLALALTATTIAAPADASLCRVYAWLLTGDGQPFEGGVVKFTATDNGGADGQLISGVTLEATSDATGYVYADLVQGASYTVTSAYYRLRGAAITVPAAGTEALEDLL